MKEAFSKQQAKHENRRAAREAWHTQERRGHSGWGLRELPPSQQSAQTPVGVLGTRGDRFGCHILDAPTIIRPVKAEDDGYTQHMDKSS